MEEKRTRKRGMRGYTIMALLGIFVVAAVLAIANKMMPGRLSTLARSIAHRHDDSATGTGTD
jgi:hypothetical protein